MAVALPLETAPRELEGTTEAVTGFNTELAIAESGVTGMAVMIVFRLVACPPIEDVINVFVADGLPTIVLLPLSLVPLLASLSEFKCI